MFKENDIVNVTLPHDVRYTARFIREENNTDGKPNGIALVQVTDKGNSWHRVGQQFHTGTRTLTLLDSNGHARPRGATSSELT